MTAANIPLYNYVGLRGALKKDFWKNLGFCPNQEGGGEDVGVCQFQVFLKPKPHGDFVTIRGGVSVPTLFTQKMGLVMKK